MDNKHVCKLCCKRFPSGKSLGGHMRSHVMADAKKHKLLLASLHEKVSNFASRQNDSDRDNNSNSGYSLRENPKKTSRFSYDFNDNFDVLKKLCKQCGKGFDSMKALCGHMSIHSEKDRKFDDEVSWESEEMFECSNNNSEIDELEDEEEVAMCLMMLSRDSSGSFNCYNSNPDSVSSDNNSVICHKAVDNNVVKDLNSDSDSDYFENGFDVETRLIDCFGDDGSNYSYNYNYNYPSKKTRYDYSYGGKNNHTDSVTSDSKKKYVCWICNKGYKTHQALGGHIVSHRRNGENYLEGKNLVVKGKIGKKKGNNVSKKVNFKCPYCPRVFKSGQAFGGHKRSHMLGSGSSNSNVVLSSDRVRVRVRVGGARLEPEVKQPPMIDLNLPAPMEEEISGDNDIDNDDDDDSQFMVW